jgi:hypothetical protein
MVLVCFGCLEYAMSCLVVEAQLLSLFKHYISVQRQITSYCRLP